MTTVVLIENQDVNIVSDAIISSGGQFIVVIRGTVFGSGIVEIQYSPRPLENEVDAKWSTLQNGIFTDNGEVRLEYVPGGHGIRAKLTETAVLATTENIFVEAKQ